LVVGDWLDTRAWGAIDICPVATMEVEYEAWQP
jgi:hypothetical protein